MKFGCLPEHGLHPRVAVQRNAAALRAYGKTCPETGRLRSSDDVCIRESICTQTLEFLRAHVPGALRKEFLVDLGNCRFTIVIEDLPPYLRTIELGNHGPNGFRSIVTRAMQGDGKVDQEFRSRPRLRFGAIELPIVRHGEQEGVGGHAAVRTMCIGVVTSDPTSVEHERDR